MLIRLSTKRDTSGNRYYIIVDHDKKIYSRQPAHWYNKEDYIEISKTDARKYIEFIESANYKETDAAL